jgi:nardilysin
MRLVVIGGFSLDCLQDRVQEMFSEVPPSPRVPPTLKLEHCPDDYKVKSPLTKFGMPFDPDAMSTIYRVVPVKNRHNLTMTWQLPPQLGNWRADPCDYIGHLLGHEGRGSVLSALKEGGWANGVYAGVGSDGFCTASSHALFSVNVMLTEEGVDKWEQVVETVYSYLGMMREAGGPDGASFPPHIYDEIKAVADFKFRFQEDEEPSDLVEDLADELSPCHAYPPEHILDGSTLAFEYDGRAVMEIVNKYMTCDNMRIDVMSSSYGRQSDYEEGDGDGEGDDKEADGGNNNGGQDEDEPNPNNLTPHPPPPPPELPHYLSVADQLIEPIFGTRYWRSKLSPATVARFETPSLSSGLHLPEPNPYLPSSFELKPFPSDDAAHPLVGALVKVADLKAKGKTNFYSGSIVKFDSTKNSLLVSYEDEEKAWYKVDDDTAFFAKMKNDDSFLVEKGKVKLKIVTLLEAGGLGEDGLRFADGGGDDDLASYDLVFPPIPPPTEAGRLPQLAFDLGSCRLHHHTHTPTHLADARHVYSLYRRVPHQRA